MGELARSGRPSDPGIGDWIVGGRAMRREIANRRVDYVSRMMQVETAHRVGERGKEILCEMLAQDAIMLGQIDNPVRRAEVEAMFNSLNMGVLYKVQQIQNR